MSSIKLISHPSFRYPLSGVTCCGTQTFYMHSIGINKTKVHCTRHIEQRTIFRQVTIFRHLFLISCTFFIFHRNRFLSLCEWNPNKFLPSRFKQLNKICFSTLRILIVKCGEIWFPWRNMVLCSIFISQIGLFLLSSKQCTCTTLAGYA